MHGNTVHLFFIITYPQSSHPFPSHILKLFPIVSSRWHDSGRLQALRTSRARVHQQLRRVKSQHERRVVKPALSALIQSLFDHQGQQDKQVLKEMAEGKIIKETTSAAMTVAHKVSLVSASPCHTTCSSHLMSHLKPLSIDFAGVWVLSIFMN